jgi:hypothetical protein
VVRYGIATASTCSGKPGHITPRCCLKPLKSIDLKLKKWKKKLKANYMQMLENLKCQEDFGPFTFIDTALYLHPFIYHGQVLLNGCAQLKVRVVTAHQ